MNQVSEATMKIMFNDIPLEISYCYERVDNETLFFIHGLGCTKESFNDLWKDKRFERYSLLTFDLPGFGSSAKSKEFSYKTEDQAEVCKLIIEKLNLRKIHLVGHSMGGAIALLLIEKIPNKIISFINLEGNLIGEDCTFSREVIKHSLKEFEETIFKDFKSKIKDTKDLATSSDLSNQLFYEWLSKSDPSAFYRSSESLVKWSDSRKLLKMFINLKIKKWYIFGERNKDLPTVKLLKSNNMPIIQVSKSGHFMMIDNPKEFYQTLFKVITS